MDSAPCVSTSGKGSDSVIISKVVIVSIKGVCRMFLQIEGFGEKSGFPKDFASVGRVVSQKIIYCDYAGGPCWISGLITSRTDSS